MTPRAPHLHTRKPSLPKSPGRTCCSTARRSEAASPPKCRGSISGSRGSRSKWTTWPIPSTRFLRRQPQLPPGRQRVGSWPRRPRAVRAEVSRPLSVRSCRGREASPPVCARVSSPVSGQVWLAAGRAGRGSLPHRRPSPRPSCSGRSRRPSARCVRRSAPSSARCSPSCKRSGSYCARGRRHRRRRRSLHPRR